MIPGLGPIGARAVKLFPASLGGPSYIRALLQPMPEAKLVPTGGIDIDEVPAHEQFETLPAFDGDLDAARRVLRLGTVLQQLRPKCRAAVELRFTHDLSYREIAMHLGVSPQMAKKYVAQGLSHCRRRMAQLG